MRFVGVHCLGTRWEQRGWAVESWGGGAEEVSRLPASNVLLRYSFPPNFYRSYLKSTEQ